jgi:hypothetical protein
MTRCRGLIAVVLISLLCLGPDGVADARTEAKQRLVEAVWRYNITVINSVIAARSEPSVSIDLAEFGRAINLLESLTNIRSNTGTRIGRVPTTELPKTVRLWERWYFKNKNRLEIDLGGCVLRMTQHR